MLCPSKLQPCWNTSQLQSSAIRHTTDVHVTQNRESEPCISGEIALPKSASSGGHLAAGADEAEEEEKTHNEASVVSRRTLQLMQLVDAKKSWCERGGWPVRATASKH